MRGVVSMRRLAMMTAGLALTMSVGFSGVAGATPTISAGHPRQGSDWSFEVPGRFGLYLELIAFDSKTAWNGLYSDGPGSGLCSTNGDEGTVSHHGKKISLIWTSGPNNGTTFTGTYSKSLKGYSGTINTGGSASLINDGGAAEGC